VPVVYLTGAAASGKSTLTRNLRALCPELVVFSYSDRLRDLIANRQGGLHEDEAMRKSAGIATPADIETLDNSLLNLVTYERANRSILIDSLAVMKEDFGFRVAGVSTERIKALNPDAIVCLYAHGQAVIDRMKTQAAGPLMSVFEADMYTYMQAQLAIQYGVIVGKPVYLFDTTMPADNLAKTVAQKTKLI
jgi:adenylate kinase